MFERIHDLRWSIWETWHSSRQNVNSSIEANAINCIYKKSMANNLGALLSNDLPLEEPTVERKVEKLIHFPAV